MTDVVHMTEKEREILQARVVAADQVIAAATGWSEDLAILDEERKAVRRVLALADAPRKTRVIRETETQS